MEKDAKNNEICSESKIEPGSQFLSKTKKWLFLAATGVVEIVALLLMSSVLSSYLLYQNLSMDNICRVRLQLPQDVCKGLILYDPAFTETYANESATIQVILADIKVYRSVVDHTFPILYVIFAGPWSDHFGRKIPLILPVIGFIVQHVFYLVSSYYIDSLDPYVLAIIGGLPRSLTGGEVAYAMAAYSYIADITPHSTRTVRHGILNAAYQLGVPIGFSLAGRLIDNGVGYATSFGICVALSTICLGILVIFAKNVTKAERLREEVNNEGDEEVRVKTWSQALNPKNNLLKVAALPFQYRVGRGRTKLLMLLVAFVFSVAPIHGEFGVVFGFVMAKIRWNAVDYGDFSTYNTVIGVVGVVLSMGILSKWMKLSDPIVGFIAGISQMCGSILYAHAATGFVMYLASGIDSMNGTMVVIARSMMSKIVSPSEMGTLFSLVAILETLTPLVMDPTYSKLFLFTLENKHWLGWFYVLSAALTIPPQWVYLWFIIKENKGSSTTTDDSKDPAKNGNGLSSSNFESLVQTPSTTNDEHFESSKLNRRGRGQGSRNSGDGHQQGQRQGQGHTNLAFSPEESGINHVGIDCDTGTIKNR